ncbi:acyltransferase [Gryllotalpicola daejeonensis]|uniref:Acyltransferase n=1 Tax=Gryllotalpicola daejeonensis TaxID=993087 RepID=A0ABP7ZN87_9MICO
MVVTRAPSARLIDPTPLPKGAVGRLDSLTGLRWFAAFVVFLHHVQNLGAIPAFAPFLRYGTYGVTFFFVLSGFVLAWSYRPSTGAPTFYWRRFSRIYPSHFVALLIAIPIFYSFHPDPAQTWVKPVSFGILILSLPLIQAWWSNPVVELSGNPAAWTLTCEFFFYALHPWIMKPFRRLSANGAILVAAGVFVLELVYREAMDRTPGTAWVHHIPQPVVQLPAFVIGMCLAVAMRRGWRLSVPPIVAYALTGAFVLFLGLMAVYPLHTWIAIHILAFTPEGMVLVCALMIAAVATRDIVGARSVLRNRFWVTLGEWSFCFYLVHATFIYLTRSIFGPESHGWATLWWWAAMFVVGLAATAALHYFIEKPVERQLRTWWDARGAKADAGVRVPAMSGEAA